MVACEDLEFICSRNFLARQLYFMILNQPGKINLVLFVAMLGFTENRPLGRIRTDVKMPHFLQKFSQSTQLKSRTESNFKLGFILEMKSAKTNRLFECSPRFSLRGIFESNQDTQFD